MMMKKPVILDCDPGADDFLAILLLLASPEIEVLGITTVFGNAAVEQTAWNAARACLAAGKAGPHALPVGRQGDPPLFVKPLRRPLLYPWRLPQPQNAV